VWIVLIALIIYDVICVVLDWPTISSQMRIVDEATGHLFRWMWLALWFHWFVGNWPVPRGL
jgi:hypothetical protein